MDATQSVPTMCPRLAHPWWSNEARVAARYTRAQRAVRAGLASRSVTVNPARFIQCRWQEKRIEIRVPHLRPRIRELTIGASRRRLIVAAATICTLVPMPGVAQEVA